MAAAEHINFNTKTLQRNKLSVKRSHTKTITNKYSGICYLRILIAEHCDFNRHLLETFLKCQGYDVTSVQDGLEALQRFYYDNAPFDLVLTDIDIPGINGNILARHIRNLNSAVPVIALSNSTTSIGEYFDGVIKKPLQLPELLEIVEGALPHL